ncbi:MAG: fimbrillin family protein [Candidatus Cryptobacteroides sp.]|uniref:fimbrillin family protein n=1 Tax=Candidatus Cryptobacteroides sp. TaxID=2952915 RepID=UPI002A80154A|nr:fimbrillin family protein [Candidatus Cryptobacteroides sp.]MDY5043179.1 fimbrillin family protein [Candidatus Cryptobacteroides sp.]
MRLNKLAGMLLLSGAVFVSCNGEALEPIRSRGNTAIIASVENDELTRTCIDPTVYKDNVTGLLWTPEDLLGVYGSSGTQNAKFENTSTAKAANATFTGKLSDGETPQYCYYPYSEANADKAYNALTGKVSAVQSYSAADGLLSDDWKYGTSSTAEGGAYKFKMKSLFAMAKVVVDATGSAVEGESLKSVSIRATSDSEVRAINGDFTFSAADGTYSLTKAEAESTTMAWTGDAVLSSGKKYTGYITVIPNVIKDDKITITITTDKHKAVFEVPCLTSLASGYIYLFPMTLTELAAKMKAAYGTDPVISEIATGGEGGSGEGGSGEGGSGEGGSTDPQPTVTTGTFTACAFNVDGLPQKISGITINGDGPGSSGTTTMAGIANNLGWDIIAASEDFEYDSQLVAGLSNYSHGTWRGSVSSAQLISTANTDGLNFFWRTSTTIATGETYVKYNDAEGGLTSGANTCIKKGFRHYVVTVDATNNVVIDVYITHMNTYSGSGNTESNPYIKAVLSQLRQLRDYVLTNAKTNKRPAIIMGDTNMRYTRHDIKANFLDVVAAYDNNAGYTVSDPWVEFHRGGVYPQWNSLSLMTRFAFAGDKENDIVCADNQKGEVVDKIWYINVPGAEVQLKATAHQNEVENFRKSTSSVSYSGVMVEDENGKNTSGNTKYTSGQTVSYTKDVGYSDHFPVVTTFEWTKTVAAAQ